MRWEYVFRIQFKIHINKSVKVNHIYIWVGAHAEQLIEDAINEDSALDLNMSEK